MASALNAILNQSFPSGVLFSTLSETLLTVLQNFKSVHRTRISLCFPIFQHSRAGQESIMKRAGEWFYADKRMKCTCGTLNNRWFRIYWNLRMNYKVWKGYYYHSSRNIILKKIVSFRENSLRNNAITSLYRYGKRAAEHWVEKHSRNEICVVMLDKTFTKYSR